MKEQFVYLVMCARYDEGVISSSIRVFGDEEVADTYKQDMVAKLPDIYGVDYVMKVKRQVLANSPKLQETDLY